MVTTYENVPVFRAASDYAPEHLVGRATVEVDEENKKSIITIETSGPGGVDLVDFILMGDLKALGVSGMVYNVDAEKAKEYWSRQQ